MVRCLIALDSGISCPRIQDFSNKLNCQNMKNRYRFLDDDFWAKFIVLKDQCLLASLQDVKFKYEESNFCHLVCPSKHLEISGMGTIIKALTPPKVMFLVFHLLM